MNPTTTPSTHPAPTIAAPSRGTLSPVPITDVRITGGFWAERQGTNLSVTLRHCVAWMERLGWISNFDRVAEGRADAPAGREFADSEIYKLLEALAWESARSGDEWVESTFRSLSARVVAAQQDDGYLNTRFGVPGGAPRYSDLMWGHELYCAGHLIQAAVARLRTAGPDVFTDAAVRLADHICATFGPDGMDEICGHPEIEVALAELSRATGDLRYLEQARLFVERHGRGRLGELDFAPSYFLDDVPVRDAEVLRGHAVRALYLASGAVDVAIETGDEDLLDALRDQWRSTVARRTYLTGGMGSRHEGESFGEDFELPSDRAYSETCASVASVMFSWRLLLADGDPRYADLIERTLYNVIATSPDERGDAFFYVNPLQRNEPGVEAAPDRPNPRAASSQRAPWFEVSCCPNNIARTMASLSGYIATVDGAGLQLHQYMPSSIRTEIGDGRTVALRVETDYPTSGSIAVVVEGDSDEPWTLTLRIPAWARGRAAARVGSEAVVADGATVAVTRAFKAGDVVTLELPVEPRLTAADDRVDAIRDCVAVEAGPLVLCAESIDQSHPEWSGVRIAAGAIAHPIASSSGGPVAVVDASFPTSTAADAPWPFGAVDQRRRVSGKLLLVPYHRWAQRGPSRMRVWIPVESS